MLAVEFDGSVLVFKDSGETGGILLGNERGDFFLLCRGSLGVDAEAEIASVLKCHPLLSAARFRLAGVKFGGVNVEQPDERVAGEDVEINVRQRLQLVFGLSGCNESKKKAQAGDFRGLL